MRHTPGRWKADRGVILDTGGLLVVGVALDPLSRLSDEELYSNARQMAAAPDLLKALQDYVDQDEYYTLHPDLRQMHDDAVAAIAKARGEA